MIQDSENRLTKMIQDSEIRITGVVQNVILQLKLELKVDQQNGENQQVERPVM